MHEQSEASDSEGSDTLRSEVQSYLIFSAF